jgi:hypothetical protein
MVEESLNNESWDLLIGNGKPGCLISSDSYGNKTVTYHRFGDNDGIEPLIHSRNFNSIKKDYVEVSEEFRLFHNLYHKRTNNKFVKFDEGGDEEDVILIEKDRGEKCKAARSTPA